MGRGALARAVVEGESEAIEYQTYPAPATMSTTIMAPTIHSTLRERPSGAAFMVADDGAGAEAAPVEGGAARPAACG